MKVERKRNILPNRRHVFLHTQLILKSAVILLTGIFIMTMVASTVGAGNGFHENGTSRKSYSSFPDSTSSNGQKNPGHVRYTVFLNNFTKYSGTVIASNSNSERAVPGWMVYDPANGYVYVENLSTAGTGSPETYVLNATTFSEIGTLPVAGPMIYDPTDQYIYSINDTSVIAYNSQDSEAFSIAPPSNLSTDFSQNFVGFAYDSQNGTIYIVLDESSGVMIGTLNLTAKTMSGQMVIPNDQIMDIMFANYTGNFTGSREYLYTTDEDGNISAINPVNLEIVSNLNTFEIPGYLSFVPQKDYLYSADSPSEVTVFNLSTGRLIANISTSGAVFNCQYVPSNSYIYFSTYDADNVSVVNTTTNSIIKNINTGIHPDYLVYDPSGDYVLVANQGTGQPTIDGASISVISLESNSSSVTTTKYTLRFAETGLPPGTAWYVNISNSTGVLIGSSGPVTVSSYNFTLPGGTYSYTIASSIPYYQPNPEFGSIIPLSSNMTVNVTFSLNHYSLSFMEKGLPSGMKWTVNINSTNYTSTGVYLNLSLPYGKYTWIVYPPTGYEATQNQTGGLLLSSNLSTPTVIYFSSTSTSPPPTSKTSPAPNNGYLYYALVAVIAVIAVGAIFYRMRRKVGP